MSIFFNDGPWGGRGGGAGKRPTGNSGDNKPPVDDIDEAIRKAKAQFEFFVGGGGGGKKPSGSGKGIGGGFGFIVIGLIALLIWLSTGVYQVNPGEQAVIMRFGKFHRTETQGLRFHAPYPIEHRTILNVQFRNKIEIGNIVEFGGRPARLPSSSISSGYEKKRQRGFMEDSAGSRPNNNLILTSDRKIADVSFSVQWNIKSPEDFLFKVKDPAATVEAAAQSAVREVVSKMPYEVVFATNRTQIQEQAQEILQDLLDEYGTGINVLLLQMGVAQPPAEVFDAFRDVETAKQDRDKMIEQAEAYRGAVIPKARGEAQKIILAAEGYKEAKVANAKGQVAPFLAIYKEYLAAPEVTRARMYIETMEEVMSGADKIVIDSEGGVVPYLPLPSLDKGGAK